ncbi:MAG: hypothetical protein HC848_04210 [Limnobacter sp.]|nr:hypothetical protein [Limnobacter sp.]
MKKIIFSLLLLLANNAFSGMVYPEKAHQLAEEIVRFLYLEKVCKKGDRCRGGKYVTTSGDENSIFIDLFNSNDIGEELISEIISMCHSEYIKTTEK